MNTGNLDHPTHCCYTHVWLPSAGVLIPNLYAVYRWPWTWRGRFGRASRWRRRVFRWWRWSNRTESNWGGSWCKPKTEDRMIDIIRKHKHCKFSSVAAASTVPESHWKQVLYMRCSGFSEEQVRLVLLNLHR